MIELVKIEFSELPSFVEAAYEGDDDLLTDYHIDTYSLNEAIETTLLMIEVTNDGIEMQHFGVIENEERIGYLSVFSHNLYSFGININRREKDLLITFWELIKNILNHSFITMLYPNNTRAINWLKKCDMVEVESEEEDCITLLYHNLN